MSLEARSGIKILSKLILDKLSDVDTKTNDNNIKVDNLRDDIQLLTTQIRILVGHLELVTGDKIKDDEINSL
jgi:hypothetical protein